VKDIIIFGHDWNDEVIAQFFMTLSFDKHGTIMHFVIEGSDASVVTRGLQIFLDSSMRMVLARTTFIIIVSPRMR